MSTLNLYKLIVWLTSENKAKSLIFRQKLVKTSLLLLERGHGNVLNVLPPLHVFSFKELSQSYSGCLTGVSDIFIFLILYSRLYPMEIGDKLWIQT